MSELDDERAAHEEIAEICFACGVETDDGTSVSAVRNLAARLSRYETALAQVRQLAAVYLASYEMSVRLGAYGEVKIRGELCKKHGDELIVALSHQPAESKLEAVFQKHIRQCQSMVETFDRVGPEHMKTFHQGMVAGLERAIEIINYRDAQRSTPSGEEMKRV